MTFKHFLRRVDFITNDAFRLIGDFINVVTGDMLFEIFAWFAVFVIVIGTVLRSSAHNMPVSQQGGMAQAMQIGAMTAREEEYEKRLDRVDAEIDTLRAADDAIRVAHASLAAGQKEIEKTLDRLTGAILLGVLAVFGRLGHSIWTQILDKRRQRGRSRNT
jgi:hypothetical protein